MMDSADQSSQPVTAEVGTRAWPAMTSAEVSGSVWTVRMGTVLLLVSFWSLLSVHCGPQPVAAFLSLGPEQKPEWEGIFSQNGARVQRPKWLVASGMFFPET